MEFFPFHATIAPINRVSRYLGGGFKGVMNQNIEVITYAVSLIFKAAIIAAKYSGRVRKRSLKRLAIMDIDAAVGHDILDFYVRELVTFGTATENGHGNRR